jgi:hypothetical protein
MPKSNSSISSQTEIPLKQSWFPYPLLCHFYYICLQSST